MVWREGGRIGWGQINWLMVWGWLNEVAHSLGIGVGSNVSGSGRELGQVAHGLGDQFR